MKKKESQFKFVGNETVVSNRRARYDYEISETLEAGMVLTGTEVKSIRQGGAQIAEAYVSVEGGAPGSARAPEAFIVGMFVPPYLSGNYNNVEPRRRRKLLLHRNQINRLIGVSSQKGYTLIPLKLHLKNGRVKVDIGVAKGRKTHDKRRAIAERETKRDMERGQS